MLRSMKKVSLFSISLLLCTGSLLFSGAAWGEPEYSPGRIDPHLELSLSTEKDRVLLGEPVYLLVQLRNTGPVPIEVDPVLAPQVGNLKLEIASTNQPPFRFSPRFYTDVTAPRLTLAPNASLRAIVPIFFGSPAWTFQRPGDYRLTASYHDAKQRNAPALKAQTHPLAVSEEDGAGRFLLEDGEESVQAGKLLLWRQGDHLQKGAAKLKALADKFPESPLADFANLALASNLAQPFRDYSRGQVRQPDYQTALRHLEKIRPGNLPSYLRVQKNLDQARCLLNTGQTGAVKTLVEKALKLSGGGMEYQPLLDKALRLEPRLKDYMSY